MHIGLIGGIGPAATEFYYRGLTDRHAKSGTRLKAMGLVANGAQQFQYVEDSAYGQPCEFVQSADGQRLLCVPTSLTSLRFLDASCTQPVAVSSWPWYR